MRSFILLVPSLLIIIVVAQNTPWKCRRDSARSARALRRDLFSFS